MITYTEYHSPLGLLYIAATGKGIYALRFPGHAHWDGLADWQAGDSPLLRAACSQLDEYFAGQRKDFALPLDTGGTPFQNKVWQALQTIAYGETANYGQLAQQIGQPRNGARAVGAANGRNPVSIIVPCHRVIGADGALVGYAGGLERKRFLLALERQSAAPAQMQALF